MVSTALDISTDSVVRLLLERGIRVTRWNTEDYPFASKFSASLNAATVEAELTRRATPTERFRDVTAIWYRRIRTPERPEDMDAGVYDFCLRESRAALIGGLLATCPPSARWMSAPSAVWSAEHKLWQLAVARECGFEIPDTVVTNDADEARRAFVLFSGEMIAKPVRTGYVEVSGMPHSIFTSAVSAGDLEDMTGADLSPVIFQPLIPKRCDVRVTVVGDEIFAAEIDSQSDPSARIDWRRTDDPELPHRRVMLCTEVEERIRSFMRRLHLEFGALDFVATPTGRLVFLEVNPNGQWLWLDDKLDFGISGAIARWLAA